jgi:hypothetical protein
MMDVSTGWQNATFKDKLSGETTAYYFNKDEQTSLIPPLPTYYDDKSQGQLGYHKKDVDMNILQCHYDCWLENDHDFIMRRNIQERNYLD